jgi:hypothetical protein
MATVFGTQLTYAEQKQSTKSIKSTQFYGKGHVQSAQEFLATVAGVNKPAEFYHYFEPITMDE